jgi:hypothetical protein
MATGASDGGGGESGEMAAPLPDSTACAHFSSDNCATAMNCQSLSGQPISDDSGCLAPNRVVACGTKVGCAATPTRATDASGNDWIFPTNCIPAGWTDASDKGTRFDACSSANGAGGSGGAEADGSTSTDPPLPDSTACGQLTLATCATGMNCQALSGQLLSTMSACLNPYTLVACGTMVGCSPTATRAVDKDGHDWVFPSTCIPAGWTNASGLGTRFDPCPAGPTP